MQQFVFFDIWSNMTIRLLRR